MYRYLITKSGYYTFGKVAHGKWRALIPWTKSKWIQPKENHLKVVAKGSGFFFYVNGKSLGQSRDSSFGIGKFGLYAENAKVSFDDLVLRKIR